MNFLGIEMDEIAMICFGLAVAFIIIAAYYAFSKNDKGDQ